MSTPLQEDAPPQVAVVGAGAVGSYFGGMLARGGVKVVLIGRPAHVEAIRRDGLILDTLTFCEQIRVEADTDLAAARGANLVLVCVKTLDTEEVTRALMPHLAQGATVLSLQNGVDNTERMRRAGLEAIAAVVYVAVHLAAPGHVRHSGRGELLIGAPRNGAPSGSPLRAALEWVSSVCESARIPCRIAEDIEPALWTKMVMNCAYNAISALTHAQYGVMVGDGAIRTVMLRAADETVAVAQARGVQLDAAALHDAVIQLGQGMPEATSSMAQDIGRSRRTEIESLNGYVAREGARLGIATPVNQALQGLIQLLERDRHGERKA